MAAQTRERTQPTKVQPRKRLSMAMAGLLRLALRTAIIVGRKYRPRRTKGPRQKVMTMMTVPTASASGVSEVSIIIAECLR